MSILKASNNDAVLPRDLALSRRRFLVAAIALSGIASGIPGPSVFRLSRAWAQSGTSLEEDISRALVQMARRLYPHDSISDEVYAQVLDDVLASTVDDESFAETFRSAEQALNSQQPADFIDLEADAQIGAMRAVEQMSFFAAIQGAVKIRLYNHPAIWNLLGYEGPSFEQGGYLNRGAGEIDWLPEGE
jgi:hypothetical protein